jgi:hypothetical protein
MSPPRRFNPSRSASTVTATEMTEMANKVGGMIQSPSKSTTLWGPLTRETIIKPPIVRS